MTRRLLLLALVAAVGLLAGCGGTTSVTVVTSTPTIAPRFHAPAPTSTSCTVNGPLPDARCTPGATNPAVTQATIGQTICVHGWTATIRPPLSVTAPIKLERMSAYGLAGQSTRDYELDHLISLELGGAPADVANLWPEAYAPTPGAHEKDLVENYLRAQVCNGSIPLATAQQEIATNWLAVYNEVGAATLAHYGYHASASDG